MPFLAFLSPLKFLLDPKVLIGLAIAGLVAYHFYEVGNLNSELNEVQTNYAVLINTNEKNVETIGKLERDLNTTKENSSTLSDSYIDEIKQLKNIINELNSKPVFTNTITIKDPSCSIKVKQLTPADSNGSLIRIISEIGK